MSKNGTFSEVVSKLAIDSASKFEFLIQNAE